MRDLRPRHAAAVVLAAIVMLAVPQATNAQDTEWKPADGPPPFELRWPGKHKASLAFKDLSVTGKSRWDLRAKLVAILWTHEPTVSREAQEIETTFWPTALAGLSDGKTLVVAGKRPGGNTVIEAWSFHAPELTPKDEAKSEYVVKPAALEHVETVYDAAVQGRDLVAHIVAKVGSATGFLVQFVDSRAVYEFDLGSKPAKFTLVASPNAAAVIPGVPQLMQRYTRVYSADHKSRGYVYVFTNDDFESVTSLVLLDADRNGALDGSVIVVPSAWAADGWEEPSNFNPLIGTSYGGTVNVVSFEAATCRSLERTYHRATIVSGACTP